MEAGTVPMSSLCTSCTPCHYLLSLGPSWSIGARHWRTIRVHIYCELWLILADSCAGARNIHVYSTDQTGCKVCGVTPVHTIYNTALQATSFTSVFIFSSAGGYESLTCITSMGTLVVLYTIDIIYSCRTVCRTQV